ncbi:MAG TPA: tetratricopeptide repeat protein [Rhodothermales bacterium]|nr:tetratricopeptide repeat protein [Rhodothermales bacterium]
MLNRFLLHHVILLLLACLAFTALPVRAQTLPVTTSSEEARAHFLEGRKDAFHWQAAKAREHLDAAIAADSTFVLAYLHRAGTWARASEIELYLERAESHRGSASESEGRMIDAFRAFLLKHDYDGAIKIFQQLSEAYPDDPYLPGYLGMRYYNHFRDYEEAARQFERAIARDPGFIPAHQLLGWATMNQQDFPAAEQHFRENLRLAPSEWRPYFSLGTLNARQGRYAEAEQYFEQAADRDPTGNARNRVGYVYLQAGRPDEAERFFRENIRQHPGEPNTYDSLGELFLVMGRYEEAAEQFEQALARDPEFSSSRDNLIRARIEQGNAHFEESFANQDADALSALYTEDAVLFTRHSAPTTGGRTGIRAYWASFFDLGYEEISLATLERRDAGDVVYESGIATVRRDGEVGLVADYAVLWKETSEGWKIQYDIKFRTSGGAEMVHTADVEWTELIPGVAFAAVYGDWQADAHGKLVRFAPGAVAPLHTHTYPYRGVMLQGRLTNPYVGEDEPPEMGPSDAWFVPGGVPHSNTCVSEEPCLFYTYGDARWDIEVVEQ